MWNWPARQGIDWLISPNLTPAARLQINDLLEAEQPTPEVLEWLANFARSLQELEKKLYAFSRSMPEARSL